MTGTPHLLVVDDDKEIRDLLARFLVKHGFRVETAKDGGEMFKVLEKWKIDLIVLDIMMPGDDGLTLCRRLRNESDIPVIMLTAMGEDVDRIVGLEMGADDYMPKPFNPRELMARIKAVLRRFSAAPEVEEDGGDGALRFAGYRLDTATRRLEKDSGAPVDLSAGEYDLLLAFVEHPRRVLNRDQLLDFTRGRSAAPFDRSVDIQVSRLRRKIEPDPAQPRYLVTVRGAGYRLLAE